MRGPRQETTVSSQSPPVTVVGNNPPSMEAQVEMMEPEPESDALAGLNTMWSDFMDRVTATLCPSMYVKKQANGRRPTDKRSGAELAAYIQAHPTAAEVVGENYGQSTTRPFFDQDVFIPNSELPEDPAEREAHLRDLVAAKNRTAIDLLLRWFEGEVKEEDIAIAERCGEKTRSRAAITSHGAQTTEHTGAGWWRRPCPTPGTGKGCRHRLSRSATCSTLFTWTVRQLMMWMPLGVVIADVGTSWHTLIGKRGGSSPGSYSLSRCCSSTSESPTTTWGGRLASDCCGGSRAVGRHDGLRKLEARLVGSVP